MAENLTVDVIDAHGEKAGTVDLPTELFGLDVNIPLLHQVVTAQLNAARQGTHATKTRGMVAGGGKKPYKQKGTGRARQGSIRAPQFNGGGTVHGPQPRSYVERTPKKMIKAALLQSLSDRAAHSRIHVVSAFVEGDKPSTKAAKAVLRVVSDQRSALVAVARDDDATILSLRNLPEVRNILYVDQINTYDVLDADDVVFTSQAFETFVDSNRHEEAAK
ncbi:MAG: 50S ribosomal protein L4 [Actinomycetaceae bacterium]|nr:50S ribosomal protein L4 [Actinomycetaceae bacterium]MDY6082829.1 50S ribosomal protein L4 [Actinomycetaceae bacterium]